MIAEQSLTTYRNLITLKDGARVLLRLLTPDDRQRLIDLFAPVSSDDAKYLRNKVSNEEMVGQWVDDMNYSRVLPLVAVMRDRIVGDATLHFGEGRGGTSAKCESFSPKIFGGAGLARTCCAP